MDKMATLLQAMAAWLSRTPSPRVVYAALHRARSMTPPTSFVALSFQVEGEFSWIEVAGKPVCLPRGHLALMNSHRGVTTSEPSGPIGLWVVTVDVGQAPEFSEIAASPVLLSTAVSNKKELTARYAAVAERFLQTGPAARLRLKAALLDLYATALDEVGCVERLPPPPAVEAAERFIRQRYADPELRVAQVSRAAGTSVRHLNRLFRQWRGLTPSRQIRDIRLIQAQALLETTVLRVSEVAGETGFNDPFHFSRVFKATLGHSPMQHRRMAAG